MSEKKKGKKLSCLGLFFKAGFVSFLLMMIFAVVCVIVAVQFFGADYATWTDLSSMKSYPWMVVYGVASLSVLCAFGGGIFAIVGNFVLAGAEKKSGGSRPKSRPQSNRRTTI